MSSEHKPADPAAALEMLRDRCSLHEHMPVVEHIHALPFIDPADRTVLVCVHDEANDCKHAVWFPAPEHPNQLLNEDGEIRDEVRVHCEHFLAAAYN